MAYVVTRPKGRFEIRESVHTAKGPRARSLVNFQELTDDVMARARARATRPFDPESVCAGAERAGVPIRTDRVTRSDLATTSSAPGPDRRRFVESSRRMARSLEPRPAAQVRGPGDALLDLLGFVAQIRPFRPAAATEPLRFPPLARLRAERSDLPARR